jgi:hypothetical protein
MLRFINENGRWAALGYRLFPGELEPIHICRPFIGHGFPRHPLMKCRNCMRVHLVIEEGFLHRLQSSGVEVGPAEFACRRSFCLQFHDRQQSWILFEKREHLQNQALLKMIKKGRFSDPRWPNDKDQQGSARFTQGI